jgi:hypothetical protein
MINSTSPGEKDQGRRDVWRGESKKCSTSLILLEDRISWCGWNVLAKCFEKMFDWYNLDVAQLPSSLRKVRGGGLWIRRSFLVAFQRVSFLRQSDDRCVAYDLDLWFANRRLSFSARAL